MPNDPSPLDGWTNPSRPDGGERQVDGDAQSLEVLHAWNIHGTFGRNPRFDLARVVELIDRWDPQIVALQEVDSRRDNESGINPFEFLQRELGEHGI